MNDIELKRILESTRTIASVGLSSNPTKESFGVGSYLIEHGFNLIPVNPTAPEILGRKAYPDLLSIPQKVEVVQVFRPAEDVPPIVEQAIQIGAKVVWMQLGIINHEAARTAQDAGLQVVMDHCMRVEHRRLFRQRA